LPQDLGQKSYFGKWQRPDAACTLDFGRPAAELEALVRALDFGRYENPLGAPKLHHRGRVFSVASAQAQDGDGSAAPGTVLALEADALVVATGDGALRLSEFAEPRGRRVAVADVVAALGITAGARLDGASGELAQRLGALNAELCRSEELWVRRLAALDPLEPPYARSERAGAGAPDWRELALEVPPEFASRFEGGGDALVAGFAAWLARLCGRPEFDLAFRDDALRARIAGLEAFAADVVPLRIALDEAATAEAALAKSRDALARTRKRGTFLHDAIARFPRLRGTAELAAGRLLPVLCEVRADGGPIAPPDGVLLALIAAPDGRSARLGHDTRALDEATARSMRAQWREFLAAAAASPARPLAKLPLLAPDERVRVLEAWNATAAPYPTDSCVHQLFEQQARRSPERPAASFEGETLDYRELNARANRLAAYLRGLGIGPDKLVGIFVERSLEIRSPLAVHRAGGAYVPLDPAYRATDRLHARGLGAAVVLTQERIAAICPQRAPGSCATTLTGPRSPRTKTPTWRAA
jgi:hypothetical protein